MSEKTLPEIYKIVDASGGPITTTGGYTCDYVSLKNVHVAWIVVAFDNAVPHATLVQPQRATGVLPSGAVSITHTAEIWVNEDTSASDLLVRDTDATGFTVDAVTSKKIVIFRIDPAELGAGFDVMGCTVAASGAATDFASVQYFLEERYAADQPPTAITD